MKSKRTSRDVKDHAVKTNSKNVQKISKKNTLTKEKIVEENLSSATR